MLVLPHRHPQSPAERTAAAFRDEEGCLHAARRCTEARRQADVRLLSTPRKAHHRISTQRVSQQQQQAIKESSLIRFEEHDMSFFAGNVLRILLKQEVIMHY